MIKYRVEISDYNNKFTYKFDTDTLHNEHGPAAEWASGTKEWFIDGRRHRTDGPAIEWANGVNEWANGVNEWWLRGRCLSEEEFNDTVNKDSCEGKVIEVDGKKYKLTEI